LGNLLSTPFILEDTFHCFAVEKHKHNSLDYSLTHWTYWCETCMRVFRNQR